MRRYIDFRADDWVDRTDSRMQAARWSACVEGIGPEPPAAGVLEAYPEDLLQELAGEGWVAIGELPPPEKLRAALRAAIMATLPEDADCLSPDEHTLVERMLIGDGRVALESVAELEAAYTLRMRLWCDLGIEDEEAVARLDEQLMEALPEVLMRPIHQERRGRIFVFDGMLHGLLYIAGVLDNGMPMEKFVEEVLREDKTPATLRLARNYLEAAFDTYAAFGVVLLVHEALADPEELLGSAAEKGVPQLPQVSPGQMAASMNGLLPEESAPDEKLQRALHGALRPEYDASDASSDLRFLAKQGAPLSTLEEIMASMLCVLPTQHMQGALQELRHVTQRWAAPGVIAPPPGQQGTPGMLH